MASFNLHHGVSSTGTPFNVTAALCQLDATIICVQETPQSGVSDQLSDAAAKLDMSLHRAGNDGPLGEFAIAVLTTLPVAGYEVVELGTAPGDFIPRRAQIVLLQLPDGRRLRLVNTHLTHRFTSPVQLLRLQLRLKPGLPTIIVGDLNMPRTIAARWPGYADLIRGRTFPAERPLLQLDHVLASRGIEPVGGTVLPPAGSDHLPVRAEIRVPAGTLRDS